MNTLKSVLGSLEFNCTLVQGDFSFFPLTDSQGASNLALVIEQGGAASGRIPATPEGDVISSGVACVNTTTGEWFLVFVPFWQSQWDGKQSFSGTELVTWGSGDFTEEEFFGDADIPFDPVIAFASLVLGQTALSGSLFTEWGFTSDPEAIEEFDGVLAFFRDLGWVSNLEDLEVLTGSRVCSQGGLALLEGEVA